MSCSTIGTDTRTYGRLRNLGIQPTSGDADNTKYLPLSSRQEYLGDEENFRPERWMDGEKREKMKELLVTFQVGKRRCLGEPLAKDVSFLFVVKLLQEFKIERVCNIKEDEYLDADVGLGYLPKRRKIVTKPRHSN